MGRSQRHDEHTRRATAGAKPSFLRRALAWYVEMMKELLPPTIFFFVGFNLVLRTKQMILQEQGIEFGGFVATTL